MRAHPPGAMLPLVVIVMTCPLMLVFHVPDPLGKVGFVPPWFGLGIETAL